MSEGDGMKVCAHTVCDKEFEPTDRRQIYCSKRCVRGAYRDRKIKADPLFKEKEKTRLLDLAKKQPEKTRLTKGRIAQKQYKSGKLPPWMFS